MIIYFYSKAPMWWTPKEWKMSEKEREKAGIKLMKIEI